MRIRSTFLVAIFVPAILAGGLSAKEPPATPSADTIGRWLAELDSDSFQARETATKQLVAAGRAAVPQLATAAEGDDLEVTIRSLRILHNIFKTDDAKTFDTVEAVLEKLAASKNRSVARRATYVLAAHGDIRHQRAMAALKKLDAIIQDQFAEPAQPGVTIWLDSKWQGGDKALRYLKRLKNLSSLYVVDGCPASKEALNELHGSLPELPILERGDAYLGVSSYAQSPGCYIRTVMSGSSAYGKLRKGDTVTSYNGREVPHFEAMVAMIRKSKGGDTVKLTVLRGGANIEVELTLKSWRSVLTKTADKKKSGAQPSAPSPPQPAPKSPPQR